MAEEKITTKKKKPLFLRRDWYKKIKFGKTVKKNRKWRGAKGRHNKTRLGRRGYGNRPKIGYGEDNEIKNKINGLVPTRVENLKQLEALQSGDGVIIGSVGKKKRAELITRANEMKLAILNKYKENKDELKK